MSGNGVIGSGDRFCKHVLYMKFSNNKKGKTTVVTEEDFNHWPPVTTYIHAHLLCAEIYAALKRADSKLCWRWVFKQRWQRQGWPWDPMAGVKGRTVIPNVSPVCVCVYTCMWTPHDCVPYACLATLEARRGWYIPRTGVTDGGEPPHGCWN